MDELAREELDCERDACFAYPPILDLIRVAKEIGLDVVVVSDTYFSSSQLQELLRHNLPGDVFSLIDRFLLFQRIWAQQGGWPVLHGLGKTETSNPRRFFILAITWWRISRRHRHSA